MKYSIFLIFCFCATTANIAFAQGTIIKQTPTNCVNTDQIFYFPTANVTSWTVINGGTQGTHYTKTIIDARSVKIRWTSGFNNIIVQGTYTQNSIQKVASTSSFNIYNTTTPTVSLGVSPSNVCSGSSISLTASATNQGSSPSYGWYVDGSLVGTTSTNSFSYSTASLSAGSHSAYVRLTSSAECLSANPVNSSSQSFTVTGKASYNVTLNPPATICSGSQASFQASVDNQLGNLTYTWYRNGSVATDRAGGTPAYVYLTTVAPTQGMTVYCVVSSDYWCINTPIQSNTHTVSLTSSVTPSASISIPKLQWCNGESMTLTASVSNAGTGSASYVWKLSGVTQSSTSSSLTLPVNTDGSLANTFSPGDVVTVDVAGLTGTCLSSTTASATTSGAAITVSAIPSAAISGVNLFCSGSSVTLSAAGGMDQYIWYRDGVQIASGSMSSISTSTAGSYEVWVSKNSCSATSPSPHSLTTYPSTGAGSISSPQTICYNADVAAFGATAATGGNGTYSYQWQWRMPGGIWGNVPGTATSVTYDHGLLTETREFRRQVTSCSQTVYSNILLVTVYPDLNQGSVSADQTICYGADVAAFSSVDASGGNGTYNYQWQSRTPAGTWANISGATSAAYNHGTLTATTEFQRLTTSCNQTKPSNTITVTVRPDLSGGAIGFGQTICYNADVAAFSSTAAASGGDGAYSYQWQWRTPGGTWANVPGTATSATYDHGTLTDTKEFQRLVTSCSQTKSASGIVVTVVPASVGGIAGPSVEAYSVSSGSISLTGYTGTIQNWQMKVGTGNWSNIANTTPNLTYTNVTVTTSYRALVKNGVCPAVPSSEPAITIYAVPTVAIVGNSVIPPGGSTQLVATSGLNSYQWLLNNQAIAGATSNSITVKKPGTYKLNAKASSTSPVFTTGDLIIGESLKVQFSNVNYIITTNFLDEGLSSQPNLYDLDPAQYAMNVEYFDGIGRPIQQVAIGQSPSQADVVQPVEYDVFGRQAVKHLPYTRSSDGRYIANAVTEQKNFYLTADAVAHDDDPFAKTIFEPSPLNRGLKVGGSGSAWQPNASDYSAPTDNTTKFAYDFNIAAEVILWTYNGSGTGLGLVNSGTGAIPNYYLSNTLFKNGIKDEHHNEITEFKDKNGAVILKKVQADGEVALTYYIYDNFNNLVCVLPPEAMKRILSTPSAYFNQPDNVKETFLQNWAFRYKYDERMRMIMKQVPGSLPIYMVYDDYNRLVLSQDANQRQSNTWTFTKYDHISRPVMTGIYVHGSQVDQATMAGLISTTNFFETYIGNSSAHGYTNVVFPTNNLTVNNVTYYDNYNFRDDFAGSAYNYATYDLQGQDASPCLRIAGQVTGIKTNVLNTSDYLWSVTYYDDQYKVIQVKSQNYKGGIDRTTNTYDFAGKVLKTKSIHTSPQVAGLIRTQSFSYDHAGRIRNVFHTVGEPVQWINVVNAIADGSTLAKNGGSGWSSGAFSSNSIPAGSDGWVEYTVDNTNTARMVGLSDLDVDQNYNTIDFALYAYIDGTVHVYENGSYGGQIGTYAVSDVFRVERKNGAIYYKVNGKTLLTSSISSSSVLYADAALALNGKVINVTMGRGTPEIQLASNLYNELGQLKDKTLGGAINNYTQSVDYRYNIRGWATSINNAKLDNAAATNNDTNDLFGMELLYNSVDATLGNSARFNGSVSAVKWKTPIYGSTALEDSKTYKFDYDALNRMESAAFGAYNKYTSNWSAESNAFDEVLSYDLNGNIATLQRNKATAGPSAFSIISTPMDDLSYIYQKGNQLSQVEDFSLDEKGFKNGATASDEYKYDDNGNLNKDLNKAISSITYNQLNLPHLITFNDGNTILYTYDARGTKLRQTVTKSGVQTVTDYAGDIMYESNVLKFFSTSEGRAVNNAGNYEYQFMLKDHLGNIRVVYGNPFEGGNLITNADCNSTTGIPANQNVTVSQVTVDGESYVKCVSNQSGSTPGAYPFNGGVISVKAGEKYTFKVKGYSEGAPGYLYIWTNIGDLIWPGTALPLGAKNETWVSNDFTIPAGATMMKLGVLFSTPAVGNTFYLNTLALYKHKDDDHIAGFEVAFQGTEQGQFDNYLTGKINNSGAYSRTGSSAYRLTASTQIADEIIGPAKSIHVYPGDVIFMEAYGRYLTTTGSGTNVDGLIASALQSAFKLIPAGATEKAYQAIGNLFGDGTIIGTGIFPYEVETQPKAFLNYILFDENYVPYDFGYDQIESTGEIPGTGASDKMELVAKVRKPGFIYIYLSNENGVTQEVYFDDLAIKHVKGVAEQQNDYYPFGLTFNSYSKENLMPQDYKYNGMEEQTELGLGWVDYGARMYMSDIGRWGVIDPMAGKYEMTSPYSYAFNNPMLFVDPTGMENTVYVIFTPEMDPDQRRLIVERANTYLKELGLETRVKAYEGDNFNEENLDATDNWAVIGTDRQAIAKTVKGIENKKVESFAGNVQEWADKNDSANPEKAAIMDGGRGIVIDHSSRSNVGDQPFLVYENGRDPIDGTAITLMHAAGHSSSVMNESEWGDKDGHYPSGVSEQGNSLVNDLASGGAQAVLKEDNTVYIEAMKSRYGSQIATDNYQQNKQARENSQKAAATGAGIFMYNQN